jgi:hypothetical protein
MSFVNERISDAERHRLVEIRSEIHGEDLARAHLNDWVIDRDRDAFLMFLGGHGGNVKGIPSLYVFSWGGRLLYLKAYEKEVGSSYSAGGAHIYRTFINFVLPEEFVADQSELITLLQEAFEKYGLGGRSENVTVQLDFQSARSTG